jgi:signal peptide peptidase SppA
MDATPPNTLVTDLEVSLDQITCNQELVIPYLENWLDCLWCIEPQYGQRLAEQFKNIDLASHLKDFQAKAAARKTQQTTQDSVAVVRLSGPLQKHASSFSSAGSTILARRDIRTASRDPEIGCILLSIESPGGTSAGTYELAEEVRRAAGIKPVIAHATDIIASAAYWAGVNADQISMNLPGRAGSIGTYMTAIDSSTAAAQQGIKVVTLSTGEFKGMGAPGTSLTESHLSYLQDLVNNTNRQFLSGVEKGRKLSQQHVAELADGRVFDAETSLSKKLIDKIQTFDEAFQDAYDRADQHLRKSRTTKRGAKMASEITSDFSPASIGEIEKACPGASSDFLLSAVRKELSIEQCVSQWCQELATENAALGEQITETKAQLASAIEERDQLQAKLDKFTKPSSSAPGVRPLVESPDSDSELTTASDEYWAKVRGRQETGVSRAEAMAWVNKNHPQLRDAMSEEFNTRRK